MIDAAIAYAARGWFVLPLRPAQKIPATAHGLRDASRAPRIGWDLPVEWQREE
jgi:hypothetical protein